MSQSTDLPTMTLTGTDALAKTNIAELEVPLSLDTASEHEDETNVNR